MSDSVRSQACGRAGGSAAWPPLVRPLPWGPGRTSPQAAGSVPRGRVHPILQVGPAGLFGPGPGPDLRPSPSPLTLLEGSGGRSAFGLFLRSRREGPGPLGAGRAVMAGPWPAPPVRSASLDRLRADLPGSLHELLSRLFPGPAGPCPRGRWGHGPGVSLLWLSYSVFPPLRLVSTAPSVLLTLSPRPRRSNFRHESAGLSPLPQDVRSDPGGRQARGHHRPRPRAAHAALRVRPLP